MKNVKSSSSGSQEEMEEIRALYRKEAMQRKLLYNQVSRSKAQLVKGQIVNSRLSNKLNDSPILGI